MLVFNHIHLFNLATPLLYIYVVLRFPRGISRSLALLFSFVMGAIMDIFSNTPGVTMASLTLLGLIQPQLLLLFIQRDNLLHLDDGAYLLLMLFHARKFQFL